MVANVEALDAANSIKAPQRLAALIAAELQAGERITWVGQPIPSRFYRRGLPVALGGLVFAIYSAVWIEGTMNAWDEATLGEWFSGIFVAAPFSAIGLGCLSAPFWMVRKALRTAYLLTDRRAIVVEADWWRSPRTVYSFWPTQLRHMQGYIDRDGSGDLVFGERQEENGRVDIGFIAIRNVAAVEQLVHALLHQKRMKHVSTP
jgi:hypothetical protein